MVSPEAIPGAGPHGTGLLPQQADRTGLRRLHAGQQAQQGTFAGATGSEHKQWGAYGQGNGRKKERLFPARPAKQQVWGLYGRADRSGGLSTAVNLGIVGWL